MEFVGDWQSPTSVITHVSRAGTQWIVRGTAADNDVVRR
jgi:hypothetical protein